MSKAPHESMCTSTPLPPEFVAALERNGMGHWAPVGWSAEGALAAMDEHRDRDQHPIAVHARSRTSATTPRDAC